MDAKTAEALENSIDNWREICVAELEDIIIGPSECALCLRFNPLYARSNVDCDECPIAVKTGTSRCRSSPYEAAAAAFAEWDRADLFGTVAHAERAEYAFRAAARAELAFLESLRDQ